MALLVPNELSIHQFYPEHNRDLLYMSTPVINDQCDISFCVNISNGEDTEGVLHGSYGLEKNV